MSALMDAVDKVMRDLADARAQRDELAKALADARAALLYIRETQGPLYGVGWDRVLPEDYMHATRVARGEDADA